MVKFIFFTKNSYLIDWSLILSNNVKYILCKYVKSGVYTPGKTVKSFFMPALIKRTSYRKSNEQLIV